MIENEDAGDERDDGLQMGDADDHDCPQGDVETTMSGGFPLRYGERVATPSRREPGEGQCEPLTRIASAIRPLPQCGER